MIRKYKSEINAVLFAILSFDFMASFWFSILKDNSIKLENIPLFFMVAKLLRMFVSVPTGLLADRFGNKIVFYLARYSMLLSFVILLISKNPYSLLIALCLRAVFQASFYGKVESYIYNYTYNRQRKDLFSKLVTIFYGVGDLISSLVGFLAVFIFKQYGYDGLLITSSFGTIISIILIKNIDISYFNANRYNKISEIIKLSYRAFSKNSYLLHLTIFFAVINFFGWNSSLIGTMILGDNNADSIIIAHFHNISMFMMSLGCFISWFIAHKINLSQSSFVFMLLHLIFFIAVLTNYKASIAYLLFGFIIIYCSTEVLIERSLESSVEAKTRNTVMSFANMITSIIIILGNLLISCFAKLYSVKSGIIIWISIFLIYSVYNLLYFKKYKNIEY